MGLIIVDCISKLLIFIYCMQNCTYTKNLTSGKPIKIIHRCSKFVLKVTELKQWN